MEQYFKFLLQVSLGIILFYSLYWIFLRNETYYKANRFFLIGTLLLAVILPLFPFRYTVFLETDTSTGILETIGNSLKKSPTGIAPEAGSNASLNFVQIASVIYLTGIFIFLFRLFIQTAILIRLIIKYKVQSFNGIRMVENQKYGLPFSFFNIVFINPKFHTQNDLPEILAHEKVHIRENHWADLLIIELLTVILWFNPFIWFFERSIKQNHEYLADQAVISNGNSVAKYRALLVNQLMGMQIIGITNNLNFALNKNRLKMMTKQKTPKIRAVKLAWVLPAIALLLVAFAEPKYKVKENQDVNSTSAIQKGEKEFEIHGKVVEEESGEPLSGAYIVIQGTMIGTVSGKDGSFILTDPNPKIDEKTGSLISNLVVSYLGFKGLDNVITASGNKLKNNRYTFKMERSAQELNIPLWQNRLPPPPPPSLPGPNPIESGSKESLYITQSQPEYPGGLPALVKTISESVEKYAKVKEIEGKALIGFRVNSKGVVDNIHIIKQDNDKAGKAAYAIISGLKDWKPGKQGEKPVPVNYTVPFEF